MSLYLIGYPETVFKLACRSFKNCFRRLPRRAFGTARNDDMGCLKPKFNPACHCEPDAVRRGNPLNDAVIEQRR
ncbi:MAG: hypothetical protein J6M43_05745 [Neisseriaceae bacterium]|nr:hypothetical protein [Neisseriaceae bacterium]